jgi:hypothetical protein
MAIQDLCLSILQNGLKQKCRSMSGAKIVHVEFKDMLFLVDPPREVCAEISANNDLLLIRISGVSNILCPFSEPGHAWDVTRFWSRGEGRH